MDAVKQEFNVNVTQRDIDKATKNYLKSVEDARNGIFDYNITHNCPIALAFQRITKQKNAWWAYGAGGWDLDEETGLDYEVLDENQQATVTNLVRNFDQRKFDQVKPIKFKAVFVTNLSPENE